jgi:hypothetical protein
MHSSYRQQSVTSGIANGTGAAEKVRVGSK